MAQFDVHRMANGSLILDCQTSSLEYLATRVVVPLIPVDRVPSAKDRLHPVFPIAGTPYLLATQLVATLAVRDMGQVVASLAGEHYAIVGAFDRLLTGV